MRADLIGSTLNFFRKNEAKKHKRMTMKLIMTKARIKLDVLSFDFDLSSGRTLASAVVATVGENVGKLSIFAEKSIETSVGNCTLDSKQASESPDNNAPAANPTELMQQKAFEAPRKVSNSTSRLLGSMKTWPAKAPLVDAVLLSEVITILPSHSSSHRV